MSKQKHILILTHEYPPLGGGGANACLFLAREFAKDGNKVTVITAGFSQLPEEEITSDGVILKRIKCTRKSEASSSFSEMLSYLILARKAAEKLIKQNKYDICLVFFGIPSGPLALYLKKKYKLPYIIRLGGGDIPGTQKRFGAVYKIISPVLRIVWKEASGIVANSEGLRKRAQNFESRYPLYIAENGVDSDFFRPAENKRAADYINILFVSRLIERKGLQFVIPKLKAIQKDVSEKTSKNIHLTIAGDGPYRETLENLVNEHECRSLVSFLGQKSKDEIRAVYQSADLFILPSLWEGMPNVVLEAMASGLPIIMTPCEGSSELVSDNGYISGIDSFADNITKLCTDSELMKTMGQNSLKAVNERFNWKKTANIYRKLMGENAN